MDEIVRQAMAKWPNVPHCYGWLGLDARGAWRMRDERAQQLDIPGDKIVHPALLGFINRNYACDNQGRWFFQNGPQRVYVDLELTPYVAHTDPQRGFVLQTGEPVSTIECAWLAAGGQLLLEGVGKVASVDDRDLAQCLATLRMDDAAIGDERLLAWLANTADTGRLTLLHAGSDVPVNRIAIEEIADHFGFVRRPQPDPA